MAQTVYYGRFYLHTTANQLILAPFDVQGASSDSILFTERYFLFSDTLPLQIITSFDGVAVSVPQPKLIRNKSAISFSRSNN